jgi:prepilin-type N-terminal cleavage/methylation domain-containing protein
VRRRSPRERGFSLLELMMSLTIISMILAATVGMFSMGMRSFRRTTTDAELHMKNANGLRRLSQEIRGAMSATVTADERTCTYTLTYQNARLSAVADPITGERELRYPLTSDNILRTYRVSIPNGRDGGTLTSPTGKVLVRNILAKDPAPKSSQMNKDYRPFQLTTIGSLRAITLNLITEDPKAVPGGRRYVRMKTTVILRNSG